MLIHVPALNHFSSTSIFLVCIICQLCSTLDNMFNSISHVLYIHDISGICCMSIGFPHLYVLAYKVDGFETHTTVFGLLTIICLAQIIRATPLHEVATDCGVHCGNIPANKAHSSTTEATIAIFTFVLFKKRLNQPPSRRSPPFDNC
jgi:hypothetical protein